MEEDFTIRQASQNDIGFIYNTWLLSYYSDSYVGKNCRKSVFFDNYKLVIDEILSKDETKVLIAHVIKEEDVILAYLVYEPGIAHYAFTKEAFRELRICSALFEEAFGSLNTKVDFTHKTMFSYHIVNPKKNLEHNPFHLYKTKEIK